MHARSIQKAREKLPVSDIQQEIGGKVQGKVSGFQPDYIRDL